MAHSSRWLGLGLAFVVSTAAGAVSSSCILPDKCIVVIVAGSDWCAELVGAKMWPPGSPELAVLVEDEADERPRGCACYNLAEEVILEQQVPADKYAEFVADIEYAARNNCDYLVPVGWDHNCYDEGPEGPALIVPTRFGPGSCVGSCGYAKVPKGGCGRVPTPYECAALYGEGTDDGGAEETTTRAEVGGDREVQWSL
jgi:hypothetical protein